MSRFRNLSFIAAAFLFLGNLSATAKTFTGSFYGRGEACWGYLWIRTKTIQWNTDFSACYSTYTIVKDNLEATPKNDEYILYKLNHPSKNCSWAYVGLYYYAYSDSSHWTGVGFPGLKDYLIFDYRRFLTGQLGEPSGALACALPDETVEINP